jgi:hypothetical protein
MFRDEKCGRTNRHDHMRFEVYTAVKMMIVLLLKFSPEAGNVFLRNAAIYRRIYTVPKTRRTIIRRDYTLCIHFMLIG